MEEIWKDIPGYEGLYQVSNIGRLRSMNYKKTGVIKLLKMHADNDGYIHIKLNKNGKRQSYLVSRIVYEAFKGPIPDGMEVNHIDENKTNNTLENLNLLTHRDNVNWGTHNERMGKTLSKWVVKLTTNDEILHFYQSTVEAGKVTGVKSSNISNCCNGKKKTAGGFKWKYAK